MKPRLAIIAEDPWLGDGALLASLSDQYEVMHWPDARRWPVEMLIEKLRTVEVGLTGRQSPRLPDALADDPGRFRYLLHLYGTVRPYITRRHLERGLIVTNWGDNVAGVAEGALALLLCMLKQIPALHEYARTDQDPRIWHAFPSTLQDTPVGLYGYGPIGRHMGRFLMPLGARVAIHDPFARDVSPEVRVCATLAELFATCPIVSIHCGLNDATRRSVDAAMLARLPRGGILINTARGEIVDEAALVAECRAGRLLAGLDVICAEGNWPASPLVGCPNVVVSRHAIASGKGVAPELRGPPALPEHAVVNLSAFATGRALVHVITADEYDRKT